MWNALGLKDEVWSEFYKPLSYVDTAVMLSTLVRPRSHGWIKLHSTDPLDHPIIDPQYYSDPLDVQVMLEGNHLTSI